MKAVERYEELYQKALDQNLVGLAFEIAVELTREEKRESFNNSLKGNK